MHQGYGKKRRQKYPSDVVRAMRKINSIRAHYHKKSIRMDYRAYKLARARLRDISKYHYFGHANPYTHKNPESMKHRYGIKATEYPAENLYGYDGNMLRAIKEWMKSPGHKRNLLNNHSSGSIATYHGIVVFIGILDYGYIPLFNPYLGG